MPILCRAPLRKCGPSACQKLPCLLGTQCLLEYSVETYLCDAGEAELIFCPYSYLLDPVVRAAMDISLENAVLIFDEAHNIGECPWEAPAHALLLLFLSTSRNMCCARRGPMQARCLSSLIMLTSSSQHSQPAIQLAMQTATRGERGCRQHR